MFKFFVVIFLLPLNFINFQSSDKIIVGAERIHLYEKLLENKSVALLVNHTSLVKRTHLIDTLSNKGINISKIFTPEHGFKGNIERGKKVSSDTLLIDQKKIPIISMYGKNRLPSNKDLEDIIEFKGLGEKSAETIKNSIEEYLLKM